MKNVPDSLPVILLDHRPTEMEQISKTSADIVFSGHTHDGQLFPINLITRRVYELSHGYLKKESTHFFVSSGIRLWGPPVRTTGKSEIVVVDLTFQ
jgi:predicted MPP superfamily phosphohydrolase